MKAILFGIVFSMYVTATLAQAKQGEAVTKILNDQVVAWNNGMLESYMQGYWQSDSLEFIGSSGLTYGWSKTLEHYRQHYSDTAAMGKLALNIVELKQLCPVYIFVTGKWHLTRTAGNLSGYFTLLFKKINKKWLIISDHSS